ncbi:MAG TPA: condensation domain-containing protein, partial [Clostridia bacterium]
MQTYETLIDLIVSRRDEKLRGIGFIMGETDERFVPYKELYDEALTLLYSFQSAGFKKGDEIIFQIDNNRKFVFAFWACILGGMIPVPVTTGTNDEHKLKLFKIWDILKNPKMLTTCDFLSKLVSFGEKNGLTDRINIIKDRTVCLDNIISNDCTGEIAKVKENDIALIQFSSGSTGDPKGVVITHKNVLANLSAVIRWANINSDDIGLNWMPLTHDMGLIGTHIKGVLACINQYNIETQLFIRHPSLWIQKASEHRVSLLYSPNFGYKHFLNFFKQDVERDWDLSNVKLIYNGAEPISVDLCKEFLDAMLKYGLNKKAMYPVYGLAEGTIAVTFPLPGDELKPIILNRDYLKVGDTVCETDKNNRKACTFVEVGYPIYECRVRICDDENNDLGENKTGYVCIKGANVTSGYYNNEEASRKAITEDGWLNTGDLGFIKNGRLVITGRAKDVIFIKGQNYYSHDIERVTQDIEGIELGKVVAVGVFNEKLKSDELLLFVLFKSKADKFINIIHSVKRLISEKVGIEVSEVIPIKSIPKTTSGKVQRYKLRENYLNGEYDALRGEIESLMKDEDGCREIDMPDNESQEKMVRIWEEVLGKKRVGIKDDFFESGGDSLKATQLISRIREEFGVEINHAVLFDNPQLSKLADVISKEGKSVNEKALIESIDSKGTLPLSFAQQRLWFLNRLNEGSTQYNLYSGIYLRGYINYDLLIKSFNKIIERHEILRTSFEEEDGQPVQAVRERLSIGLPLVSLMDIPDDEREKTVIRLAREEVRKPFVLKDPPLIRGKLFRTGENEHILVLSAHHIIFDGWSFKILLNELVSCYQAYTENTEPESPDLKIQYFDFAFWQMKRFLDGSIKH